MESQQDIGMVEAGARNTIPLVFTRHCAASIWFEVAKHASKFLDKPTLPKLMTKNFDRMLNGLSWPNSDFGGKLKHLIQGHCGRACAELSNNYRWPE